MSKGLKLFTSLVVLVIVVAFFMYSPKSVPPSEVQIMAKIKADLLAIWNEQKYELIPETFTEDCIHHHSSLPEPMTNHEQYTQFVKDNDAAFPDFELTLSDIHISDNNLTFLFWEGTGTNDGPFPDGSPATGKKIKIWGLAVNKIVDGKIVESWVAFNQFDMFTQMGLFGEPESKTEKLE